MKKKILSICGVVFITITTMIACNKNTAINEPGISEANLTTGTTTLSCDFTGINNTLFTSDFDANLKKVGDLHNEAMTVFFNSVTQHGYKLSDQPTFDDNLRATLKGFFESKGVTLDNGNIYPCVNSTDEGLWAVTDYQTNMTPAAQQVVNKVVNLFNDESLEITELLTDLNTLKSEANLLQNTGEKAVVLSMIVVSINSIEYWNIHLEDWRNYFDEGTNTVNKTLSKGPQTSKTAVLKKVGLSDGIGAVRGAIGGLGLGGLLGAFAGALVGAGVNSCMRAIVYGATGY